MKMRSESEPGHNATHPSTNISPPALQKLHIACMNNSLKISGIRDTCMAVDDQVPRNLGML
ncbi:MAG: hypothetical protein M1291_00020 [Thaumarchaeota archaeon]|nr:hypothetical protein [Nitrososphaerota archaeon]MDG6932893.1 hypothetical protein [Nitrososphaerota archaeon]